VLVPKANLVGKLNKGWDIAKYLLTHERDMNRRHGSTTENRSLGQIASETIGTENGMLADTILRGQIAALEIDAAAFRLTMERVGDMAKLGQAHPAVSSLLKYYGTELNKRRMELVMAAAALTRSSGKASARARDTLRARGCALRPTRSKAGPARSSLKHRRETDPRLAGRVGDFRKCHWFSNDEQNSMLRDNARGFLSRKLQSRICAISATLTTPMDSRVPLWTDFVEMGWAGILVPQNYGGLGLGHVRSRRSDGGAWTDADAVTVSVDSDPRGKCPRARGNEKQKSEYLSRIVAGDLIGTLAVDESAKHRPEKTAMAATRSGSGFILNGGQDVSCSTVTSRIFLLFAARTAGSPGENQRRDAVSRRFETAKGIRAERTPMVRYS